MGKYKLYIKKSPKGLKYLGKFTERKDNKPIEKYAGSGTYWKSHLVKNKITLDQIETTVLFETDNFSEFKQKAIEWSKLLDVKNSQEFANLVDETGDGTPVHIKSGWTNKGASEACKQRVGENNPMFGKTNLGVSSRMRGLTGYNNPTSKEVAQYTKEGVHVANYGSVAEAGRSLQIIAGSISQCCNGKYKSAGGYIWKYI